MNENLNLVEILKDCPKGMELDCTVYNDVTFLRVDDVQNRCYFKAGPADTFWTTCEGRINGSPYGKCVVFPKGKTTWEGFKPKKPKFDPKTLKPFDKILVRRSNENYNVWFPDFVSYPPNDTSNKTMCMCIMEDILMVIPYNEDTKHLVGTTEEAPEYYRYWEGGIKL